MLKIIFGDIENAIYHPPTYFDNRHEDEWITDPLSVEMIRDIDKSEVVSAHLIESPVLGPISTREISGGVKTLMLMAFDESGKIFNASSCGDNCAKWINEFYHIYGKETPDGEVKPDAVLVEDSNSGYFAASAGLYRKPAIF